MFKHILLPTDGSKLSRDAVEMGIRLAQSLGARVTGLFAAPSPTPVIYRDLVPVRQVSLQEHRKLIEQSAARYLGMIEKAARAAGVPCDVITVTDDYPADAILATAKKRKCDLICMASHGRRGLKGMLLGSETQKVLSQSTVPVLVCRKGG